MFITVKYGYELEKKFNTDVPCKMLMARIIKVPRARECGVLGTSLTRCCFVAADLSPARVP